MSKQTHTRKNMGYTWNSMVAAKNQPIDDILKNYKEKQSRQKFAPGVTNKVHAFYNRDTISRFLPS